MFFNFPPQRAYITHTKDGFRQAANSPSLSNTHTHSHRVSFQRADRVISCPMNTLTHWEPHTSCVGRTLGPMTTMVHRFTRAKEKEKAQIQTFVLIATAGWPCEYEHRGAHYWYLQYTWIHTNTHVYCTFIFSSLVANSTKMSIKCIEKNSISISTIQCERDKKYLCISAGSDLLNAVRVRIIKNYNVNIIHVTKREFLFQMSQQIIQSVSFSHR